MAATKTKCNLCIGMLPLNDAAHPLIVVRPQRPTHTHDFDRRSHSVVQWLTAPNCLHSLLPGSVAYEGRVIARTQSTNADNPKIRTVMTLSLAVAKIRLRRWIAAASRGGHALRQCPASRRVFDSAHRW